MEPIEFKEQNYTYAKDQPEYRPLPAMKDDSPEGQIVSCWKLTRRERIKILFTGKMWMSLMMFGKPLTPSIISPNKWDVLNKEYFDQLEICDD